MSIVKNLAYLCRKSTNPGPNTELKKLPPYSPFLNIVEQGIRALKAAIKADISRPNVQEQMNNGEEARRQGIPLGTGPLSNSAAAASATTKCGSSYTCEMWAWRGNRKINT